MQRGASVWCSPTVLRVIATAELWSLNTGHYPLKEFPVLMNLHALCLRNCVDLEALRFDLIGQFPQLRILQLYNSTKLKTVGQTDKLVELHVTHVHAELISQFPLEQLEILTMYIICEQLIILPRLKSIKELSLRKNRIVADTHILTFSVPPQLFVRLTKLHLQGFSKCIYRD
jgi:hypothetical protein